MVSKSASRNWKPRPNKKSSLKTGETRGAAIGDQTGRSRIPSWNQTGGNVCQEEMEQVRQARVPQRGAAWAEGAAWEWDKARAAAVWEDSVWASEAIVRARAAERRPPINGAHRATKSSAPDAAR
jgi:hypothetical protein